MPSPPASNELPTTTRRVPVGSKGCGTVISTTSRPRLFTASRDATQRRLEAARDVSARALPAGSEPRRLVPLTFSAIGSALEFPKCSNLLVVGCVAKTSRLLRDLLVEWSKMLVEHFSERVPGPKPGAHPIAFEAVIVYAHYGRITFSGQEEFERDNGERNSEHQELLDWQVDLAAFSSPNVVLGHRRPTARDALGNLRLT